MMEITAKRKKKKEELFDCWDERPEAVGHSRPLKAKKKKKIPTLALSLQ